jgi:hypothetical protein
MESTTQKSISQFQERMAIVRFAVMALRCRRGAAQKLYDDIKGDKGFSDDDFAEALGIIAELSEQPIRVIASSSGGVICGARASHPIHFSSLDQDELEEEPEENSVFHQNYVETQKLDEEYEELPEAVF